MDGKGEMVSDVSEELPEHSSGMSQHILPYALSLAALCLCHTQSKTCSSLPGWGQPCSSSTSAGGQQSAVALCGQGNCGSAWGTDGESPHRRHPTVGMEVAVGAGAKHGPMEVALLHLQQFTHIPVLFYSLLQAVLGNTRVYGQ